MKLICKNSSSNNHTSNNAQSVGSLVWQCPIISAEDFLSLSLIRSDLLLTEHSDLFDYKKWAKENVQVYHLWDYSKTYNGNTVYGLGHIGLSHQEVYIFTKNREAVVSDNHQEGILQTCQNILRQEKGVTKKDHKHYIRTKFIKTTRNATNHL